MDFSVVDATEPFFYFYFINIEHVGELGVLKIRPQITSKKEILREQR